MPHTPLSRSPGPLARISGIHVDRSGKEVLRNVSLELSSGTVTAITGPNGAGKSTLLEVIAGTLAPRSGERIVEGSIAFVPQYAAVPPQLPVSTRDVVAIGAWGGRGLWRPMDSPARRAVHEALDRLGLGELARHPFSSLSGGQRQRALLAQGLARRADILLVDEPTTGLDAASGIRIRAALREEAQRGAAVACVSHDAAVIGEAHAALEL